MKQHSKAGQNGLKLGQQKKPKYYFPTKTETLLTQSNVQMQTIFRIHTN